MSVSANFCASTLHRAMLPLASKDAAGLREEPTQRSLTNLRSVERADGSSQPSGTLSRVVFSVDDGLAAKGADLSKVFDVLARREEYVSNAIAAQIQSNPPAITGVLVPHKAIIASTSAVREASDKSLKPRVTLGGRHVKTADTSALIETRLSGRGLQQGLQRVGAGIRNAVALMTQAVGLSGRNDAEAVRVVPERTPLAARNEVIV